MLVSLAQVQRQDADQPARLARRQEIEGASLGAQMPPPGGLPLPGEEDRIEPAAAQQGIPLVAQRVKTGFIAVDN